MKHLAKIFLLTFVFLPVFFFILCNQSVKDEFDWMVSAAYPILCFPAGTAIQTPNGRIPIEQLNIGDEVIGVNSDDNSIRTQQVTSLHTSIQRNLYDITLSSGRKISATQMHPFAVWDEEKTHFSFVPMKALKIGMVLVAATDNTTLGTDTIISITKRSESTVVYNLSVEPDKTYIAEGVLVHNKGTDYYRDGSYFDPSDGTYHCPGSGGNASSCNGGRGGGVGGGGGGGLPYYPPLPPPYIPPTTNGTIRGYALSITNKMNILTCEKLVILKSCLDSPTSPETPACAEFLGKQYLIGTKFYIDGTWENIQTNNTGITIVAPAPFYYTMTAIDPVGNHTPYLYCSKGSADTQYSQGNTILLKADDTLTLLVGFISFLPWTQVSGGGNTFANILLSKMPLLTSPTLLYDKTQSPMTPGILSVKEGYTLSDQGSLFGYLNISTTNWSTDNAMDSRDWYTFFKARLSQGTTLSYTGSGGKPDPVAGTAVYATTGALTINTPWNIGTDEKIIVLVEGSLDIRSTINITGKGFIQFVVRDNISVNPTVGTAWNSETPLVEGVYVAGATFSTGTSIVAATERFVGKGMFIANKISLGRNLVTAGANKTNSADLFLYNPDFLVTAPALLQDMNLEWQEVAP